MLLDPALAAYDLTPPVSPFALPHSGTNNDVIGIHTGAGDFVWKSYRHSLNGDLIGYEHDLLFWLSEQGLPFAVPAPARRLDGQTLCPVEDGWRALFPLIEGRRPDTGDPSQMEAVGAALGQLHAVMADYPRDVQPALNTYAALDAISPHLQPPESWTPDYLSMADTLRNEQLLAWWRDEVRELRAFIETEYTLLPIQVIHGDFGPGNTLIKDGRVTAILDFEFASPDVRAMDVAAGLNFVMRLWENADPWAVAEAFCRGYGQHVRLTAAECESIPRLMRLRDVVSATYWVGRMCGEAEIADQIWRFEQACALKSWLARNARQFEALFTQTLCQPGGCR